MIVYGAQAEEERDDMEKVKLDNKRILFNLLPAHVAQHFLMSNPRNMVSIHRPVQACSLLFKELMSLKPPRVFWFADTWRHTGQIERKGFQHQ